MQGSSTGGKDRPLASIWEKAINGAQKLFGSASSDTATLDESSEKDDRSESREEGGRAAPSFNASPGFSNRRFGSFGGSAWGGNTFGSVATSRAASESFPADAERSGSLDLPVQEDGSRFSSKEKASDVERTSVRETSAKDTPVVEDELDEDGAAKARIAEVAANLTRSRNVATAPQYPAPPVAPLEATVLSQAAAAAVGAGPNAVQQAMAAQPQDQAPVSPTTSQPPAATPAQSQTAASQASAVRATPSSAAARVSETRVSEGAKSPAAAQTAVVEPSRNEAAGQAPVAQTAVGKPQVEQENAALKATVAKPLVVTDDSSKNSDLRAGPTAAEPTVKAGADAAQKDLAASKESLGFDLSKAKETISDALGKMAAKPAAAPAQSTAPVAPAPVASAPVSTEAREPLARGQAGETGQVRLPDGGVGGAKEASALDLSKKEFALSAQQGAAAGKASVDGAGQSRPNAADSGVVDTKSAQVAAGVSAGQFSRETAAAASRMQVAGTAQGKGTAAAAQNGPSQTALNAVSGGQGVATGATAQGTGQHGQSQNSEGDPAAKQEFGAALKQATSAKGAEKVADGSESFDIKAETAASRRGEAASKVRQTSYVSKTAEEVKEVIATLTKSIDRLVTDKSGAMNLKINFEGGGSLKLSVSMEGGQVVTSMQTDVVGLEGAIKSNWAELANDWNQKGLKLNAPQFQNSEAGKGSSFEDLSEFASKQDRQADARSGDGRGQGSSRTATRGFSSGGSADSGNASIPSASEAKPEVVSDKELKAYA